MLFATQELAPTLPLLS